MTSNTVTTIDLEGLLEGTNEYVRTELKSNPAVLDVGDNLDLSKLPVEKREWAKVDEIVAIVADLKDSTKLSTGKYAASTASIYEAAVAPVARILYEFGVDDIDIQGDCAIGIFWGDGRLERAFCAGVTIKTFSERHLEPQLEAQWPDAPRTGFKLGMAASRILVKRVGVPGKPDYQEEVWAGKGVNYAAKAAQSSDRREMWVTGSVWERLSSNDYVAYSCGCDGAPSPSLWDDAEIEKLPDREEDRYGRKLTSMWCVIHGPEFCDAILAGMTKRDDVAVARIALGLKLTNSEIAQKRKRAQQLRVARLGRR
jgi:class 3 adenylate cyclase